MGTTTGCRGEALHESGGTLLTVEGQRLDNQRCLHHEHSGTWANNGLLCCLVWAETGEL
jgi:hypothetical protein